MRRSLLLSAGFLLFPCGLLAQVDPGDEINDLLNRGIELYKRGKIDEAYEVFERAIQRMPQSERVYAWLKRAGEDIVMGMLNDKDRRIQDMGRRLLELAKPSESFEANPVIVKRNLEILRKGKWEERRAAHFHLVHYGPWSVKYLVPWLNEASEDDMRTRVMLVLREIGTEATLGVAECLNAEREKYKLMRQMAAIVLGNIGDERAIPILKKVYEDPNEYPEVQKEAHIALAKLTGKRRASEWKKATDYYYELAQKYYYGHPSVIYGWERHFLFWKWDDERQVLTERKVPQFAWNEQLAEEALYDLLELDPEYEKAWELLVMTLAAQVVEADASYRGAEQAVQLEEMEKSDFDRMKSLLSPIERLNVLAEMIGLRYFYGALERAMKDGTPLVARTIIDVLKHKGRVTDLPPRQETGVETAEGRAEGEGAEAPRPREDYIGYPLVDALSYYDKRVRYAAAEAILAITPREKRLGWELVIPNLSDALGETGVRVALVIYDVKTEQDYQVINRLRRTLLSINVFPVIAKSAGEGLMKARDFPVEDIILIQDKVANMLYVREDVNNKKLVDDNVFDALRDDVRTRHIPKYIIVDSEEDKEKAMSIYGSHIQRVITPDIDKIKLQKFFEQTLSFDRVRRDMKARADELALRAAKALSEHDPDTSAYPYRDAVPALIKAASTGTEDAPRRVRDIRVHAIRALGNFGDTRAVSVLVDVLDDKPGGEEEYLKPVRWEAAKALSRIFWRNKYTPSQEHLDRIKQWLNDGDYNIELAVGEALGNANLPNKTRVALEIFKRTSSFRNRLGQTAEEIEQGGGR